MKKASVDKLLGWIPRKRYRHRARSSEQVGSGAVFSRHLCRICKPAWEFAHGVPQPESELFEIQDGLIETTLTYHNDIQSIEVSAEEGCFICRLASGRLLYFHCRGDPDVLGEWFMRVYKFRRDSTGNLNEFEWEVNRQGTSLRYGTLKMYRLPKRSLSPQPFGSALKERQIANTIGTDVLVDYTPVADMMADPLWGLISAWIARCRITHECSQHQHTTCPEFPSRLVELHGSDTGIQARVVSTKASDFIKSPYMTLSHRWGDAKFITLTSSNTDALYTRIPMGDLPHTFVDALTITQRLGFHYLWIDSLCIIQDSLDDWRSESTRMGDIYRGSACNIAAATGTPGERLLERNRKYDDILPLQYTDVGSGVGCSWLDSTVLGTTIAHCSLNTRAWVLQERLLSPRVVYFCQKQIFWECAETSACEALPEGVAVNPYIDLKVWRAETDRRLRRATQDLEMEDFASNSPYALWAMIVEAYTRANLTKAKDKLIALSGIAKEMRKTLNDEYLAGLWRRNLPKELLWRVRYLSDRSNARPQTYRAPSWSWASVDASIWTTDWFYSQTEVLIDIKEVFIQPVTADPTGEIGAGHMKICGIMLRDITISYDDAITGLFPGDDCSFDAPEDSELEGLDCMLMGFCMEAGGEYLVGMLLRKVGLVDGVFRRVGIARGPRADLNLVVDAMNISTERLNAPNLPYAWDEVVSLYHRCLCGEAEARDFGIPLRDCLKPFTEVITII